MFKFLTCGIIALIILIVGGVYFHQNRTLCAYETESGQQVIKICDCYGVSVPFEPVPGDLNIANVVGGKYIYCYGFTKLQACQLLPDASLSELQKLICKKLS